MQAPMAMNIVQAFTHEYNVNTPRVFNMQWRRKLFKTGGALCAFRIHFYGEKLLSYGVVAKTGGHVPPLPPISFAYEL